jgi:hypothetical protein
MNVRASFLVIDQSTVWKCVTCVSQSGVGVVKDMHWDD